MFFKLLSYPRSLILLFLVPLTTLLFSIVTISIFTTFTSRKTVDKVIRTWARTLCFLSGVRVHARGLEQLKDIPSAVLVSNHLGHFDIPVLYSVLPISFRMAAKVELFRIPLFGWAISRAGFLPLDRHNAESSLKAFDSVKQRFLNGESFWMAPEGTRHKGEGVGEFKNGAFYLAIKAEQPLIPICIYGTHRVLPKKSLLINWGRFWQDVYVNVLPAVPTAGMEVKTRGKLKDDVRSKIVDEFSRLRKSNGVPGPSI